MKIKLFYWVIIGCIGLLSCEKKDGGQFEKDVQLMANLECEARQLKEERFNAANDIRLMEDSLAKHHLPLSPAQSQRIDSVKTAYTLRTGQLAEKITKTMDSLFAVSYKTIEQRQAFDAATEKKLQEVCK
ncbi:hypothetical protein [Runella aurantiaca]|uniref:Uncharacterized protein n=1 Tax=Runella aurantiaca TaxID=2282308 RepID=A0A369IE02_9BACT|nr:hypothetical protein [Runella aurantiaca]RDB05733.1 hypothetical protein DVG78_12135 [Runella aurantiaca]